MINIVRALSKDVVYVYLDVVCSTFKYTFIRFSSSILKIIGYNLSKFGKNSNTNGTYLGAISIG